MIVVSVSGNREGWTYEDVARELDKLSPDKVVSGGAKGVDTFAKLWANKNRVDFEEVLPDYSLPSPERYFKRNGVIARKGNIVLAFDRNGGMSGTGNTIRQARKLGKKIIEVNEL